MDESRQAERVKQVFAGELTSEELAVLDRIRGLFCAAIEGRMTFNAVVEIVGAKIQQIIRSHFNLEHVSNVDAQFFEEVVRREGAYPEIQHDELSEREVAFAKDVIGAIDFTKRNGISFAFVINLLSHDLGEIWLQHSLDAAMDSCFKPKCSGYSELTEDAIGEIVEVDD